MFQFFQIAAVFEGFFFERRSAFGMCRQAPQTFRCPQKLAEYIREVLRPDARTVLSFRTETKQCGTQVLIHLPQGLERVPRHYPFQSMPTGSDSGPAAAEATMPAAVATDGLSSRSTTIHASRTASKSVMSWVTPRCEG